MKIYIPQLNLKSIICNIENLNKYCINKDGNLVYELYTEDNGIYKIEDSKIYKIEMKDNENYEYIKNYEKKNYDLLIDHTTYDNLLVKTQLPMNYIMVKVKYYEYKTNKDSQLSFIMETSSKKDNECLVMDYYFNYVGNITNEIFKEELNMFLSKLI
jgi:hypothetical protein